jgi:hypothetical protein
MKTKNLILTIAIFSLNTALFSGAKTVWSAKNHIPIALEHGHPPQVIIDGCKLSMDHTSASLSELSKKDGIGHFVPYPGFGTWSRTLGHGWEIKNIYKATPPIPFTFCSHIGEARIENIHTIPFRAPAAPTSTSLSILKSQKGKATWNTKDWILPKQGKGVITFSTTPGTLSDIIVALRSTSAQKSSFYQIVIGGNKNKKSFIRKKQSSKPVSRIILGKQIDSSQEQYWWIILDSGLFRIGSGIIPGQNEIIRYHNESSMDLSQIGFSNSTTPIFYENIKIQPLSSLIQSSDGLPFIYESIWNDTPNVDNKIMLTLGDHPEILIDRTTLSLKKTSLSADAFSKKHKTKKNYPYHGSWHTKLENGLRVKRLFKTKLKKDHYLFFVSIEDSNKKTHNFLAHKDGAQINDMKARIPLVTKQIDKLLSKAKKLRKKYTNKIADGYLANATAQRSISNAGTEATDLATVKLADTATNKSKRDVLKAINFYLSPKKETVSDKKITKPGSEVFDIEKTKNHSPVIYTDRWNVSSKGTLYFDVKKEEKTLAVIFKNGINLWLGYDSSGKRYAGLQFKHEWLLPKKAIKAAKKNSNLSNIGEVVGRYKFDYDFIEGKITLTRTDSEGKSSKTLTWSSDKFKLVAPCHYAIEITNPSLHKIIRTLSSKTKSSKEFYPVPQNKMTLSLAPTIAIQLGAKGFLEINKEKIPLTRESRDRKQFAKELQTGPLETLAAVPPGFPLKNYWTIQMIYTGDTPSGQTYYYVELLAPSGQRHAFSGNHVSLHQAQLQIDKMGFFQKEINKVIPAKQITVLNQINNNLKLLTKVNASNISSAKMKDLFEKTVKDFASMQQVFKSLGSYKAPTQSSIDNHKNEIKIRIKKAATLIEKADKNQQKIIANNLTSIMGKPAYAKASGELDQAKACKRMLQRALKSEDYYEVLFAQQKSLQIGDISKKAFDHFQDLTKNITSANIGKLEEQSEDASIYAELGLK